MKKLFNSITLGGKIILLLNSISLIGALITRRYTGLPFILVSILCVFSVFTE